MNRTRAFGRSLRDHPAPVALVGVGLGWLLALALRNPDRARQPLGAGATGRYGRGRVDLYGNPYQPRGGTSPGHGADLAAKARAAGAGLQRIGGEGEDAFLERVDAARGAVLGVLRQAGEAATAFRDRVEQALAGAAEQARRIGDEAVSIASDAGHAVADAAGRVGAMAGELAGRGQAAAEGVQEGARQASGQARSLGSRTTSYLQEHPLLLGALGVVAGAALGLLLPSSRSERMVLGRVREGMRDRAEASVRAAGQQVADAAGRVRSVVEETAAAGREAVKRELSASDMPDRRTSDEPTVSTTSAFGKDSTQLP